MNTYEPGTPKHGKYVIYLRVSTTKQGITGLGIDAQRQTCHDYLDGGDWKVIKEFTEVESGAKKDKDRPQLAEALELCAETKATLLVAKLDRLARNVAFVSALMESKVDFVAADMPHANKLTIHIIAAMAEYERDQISQRTKAALAAVKDKGKKLGNKNIRAVGAMGRAARTVQADETAEAIYAVIERIRSFGITSMRKIAVELVERKVPTPSGKRKWHPQQVKLIIDRVERRPAT